MVFIPTYLYIKQHTVTGKLYFGKSSRNEIEMLKYKGSGKYWKDHIKYHGKEHVITLWYQLYDNIFDLVADALSMSKSFDIVNNESWLNLQIENGLDGGTLASDETKKLLSKIRTGKGNSFYGKTHSDETKRVIGESSKLRKVSEENKIEASIRMSGDKNPNYGKPVSEDRRKKQSISMSGRKISKEKIDKSILYHTKRFDILSPFNCILVNISMKEMCALFGFTYQCIQHAFKKNSKYKNYIIIKKY